LRRLAEIPLVGGGGEAVDFARTIVSHGVAELPPNRVDLEARTLGTTLPILRGGEKLRIETFAGSSADARSLSQSPGVAPSGTRTTPSVTIFPRSKR
jgi:hypothetical protein